MAADQFTEVTQESLGGRLGNSLKGILFGIILFLASFPVLFWNEGRAVSEARSLAEGAANTVAATADKADPANEGKLVHMTGKADTTETLSDQMFGITAGAIKLRRTVQMYQWKETKESSTEKKLGGGSETTTTYKYATDWSEQAINSGDFKKPEGHVNPTMPFSSESQSASAVTVGAFKLPSAMIEDIGNFTPVIVTQEGLEKLPGDLRGRARLNDGGFYIHAAGESAPSGNAAPQVGDVRVTFSAALPGDVSLIARQSGDSFVPYVAKAGMTIQMLSTGRKSATEMFQAAQAKSKLLTWVLRLAGFLAMGIGMSLVVKPLSVIADIVPFIGSIVGGITGFISFMLALPLTLITISVAWVFYRPIVGVPLLIAGIVGLVLIFMKRSKKANATTPQ